MKPQRIYDRYVRTQAGEKHPKVLDAHNDKLYENHYLHPTKGYRRASIKRGKAEMITANMKVGKFPLAIFSWEGIKRILKGELAA